MFFPGTFTPYLDGSGQYGVSFVDLPGCVSIGENLEDALRMAAEALSLHIGVMISNGETPPAPSSLEDAKKKDCQEAEREKASIAPETLYQMVYFEPAMDAVEKMVMRVTISLRPMVLNLIDKTALERGMTRSGLITAATREYCQRARG